MGKLAMIYWTGTGNTKQMADAIKKGAESAGSEVELFEVEQFAASKAPDYDGLLFGCPAMGAEVLEESCFEPFFAEVEPLLKDKPVVLFGSYGWGGGAWMEDWAERTRRAGAKLFGDGLAIENEPDADGIKSCEQLGREFAEQIG